jgi:hypothetical protein
MSEQNEPNSLSSLIDHCKPIRPPKIQEKALPGPKGHGGLKSYAKSGLVAMLRRPFLNVWFLKSDMSNFGALGQPLARI